jgi:hypothetical protein
MAITAELEAEARGLRDALAEFSEGTEPPETETRRHWDFEAPFVTFADMDGLCGRGREALDRVERGITNEQRRTGAADLRLLLNAYTRCDNDEAQLLIDDFSITDDPFEPGPHRFYLNVEAPMPNGAYNRNEWGIELCR